jgi:hypothetical protein
MAGNPLVLSEATDMPGGRKPVRPAPIRTQVGARIGSSLFGDLRRLEQELDDLLGAGSSC